MRVDEDLPAAGVEQPDDTIQLRRRVVGHALRGRIVDIRREHRRGVGLDDAVHHDFHGADLEPVVTLDAPADGVEPIRIGLAEPRRHRERRVDAQRQLARGPDLLVERELVLVAAGVLDAGHAQRMGSSDAGGQRTTLLRPARCRHHLADEALGRFLEQAFRLAGAGLTCDLAVGRIRRGCGNRGRLQRLAVHPRAVPVEADQRHRPVGHGRIQLRARRETAGKRSVVPAAAANPGCRRVGGGEVTNALLDLVERARAAEIQLLKTLRAAEEVDVAVVESRQHGRPTGIERPWSTVPSAPRSRSGSRRRRSAALARRRPRPTPLP